MTETKPHWSFWVICIVALVWNAMGSINFVMQMNPAMLANYPDAAKALIADRPVWATVAFAVAVFGGLFGDLLLLLRKAAASHWFVASLLGVIVVNVHTFLATSAMDIWVGSLLSLLVAAFLIGYTQVVKRKGWIT